jgi:iron complex transport system substrate-binding protein
MRNTAKLTISVALIILGASLAIAATSTQSPAGPTDGIIIDFGGRDITFVSVDLSERPDALSALTYACDAEGFQIGYNNSTVYSIDSKPDSGGTASWGLYVTKIGDRTWTKVDGDPSEILVANYSAVAWALCAEGGSPTPAVDSTGVSYYGYPVAKRVITLAPSVTETVVAIGGLNAIVGTDLYSDFPMSVVEAQIKGRIAIVGGYSNPSFELILKQNPDLVVCISSQASHVAMADKLRNKGVNVIVTNDGESIDTILDNTHMVGTGMGYEMGSKRVIDSLNDALNAIQGTLDDDNLKRYPSVMVALSTDKAPWVSGSDTYLSDILEFNYATNAYDSINGWQQVNSESIFKYNPEYILIVGYEGEPNEADYQKLLDGLPAEWKRTDAFKNGDIYVFEESSASLASRPSPRAAQITELVARILHPGSFGDGIVVPKYIGDDFRDYLTITKEMNYDE